MKARPLPLNGPATVRGSAAHALAEPGRAEPPASPLNASGAAPLPDDSAARLEALAGDVQLLRAIVAELEGSNAQLRRLAGLDPLPPTIGAGTPWRTIGQVAGATCFSESQIRKLIAQRRIVSQKVGGRVFIDISAPLPCKPRPR